MNTIIIPRPSLDTALAWVRAGYAVVPLGRPGADYSKFPHPRLGKGWWSFKDGGPKSFVGMRLPEDVERWWKHLPDSGVGIVTGQVSRVLVIDADRHDEAPDLDQVTKAAEGGSVKLADLLTVDGVKIFDVWAKTAGVDLSDVPQVRTPRDGRHYYFRLDRPLTKGRWLPGVDAQADGTYVPAPGVRTDRGEYRLISGDLSDLPPAPEVLLRSVETGRREYSSARMFGAPVEGRGDGELASTAWFLENGFTPGARDTQCFKLAARLHGAGLSAAEVTDVIRRVWELTPGQSTFPWSQAQKCIQQGLAYEVEAISDWRG